jgi:hypothetical protein
MINTIDMIKPRKPKSQRLGRRIRKKIQNVADDMKQAKKRRKAERKSGDPKDTKAPKKKQTLADKRIERLKPISKGKKGVGVTKGKRYSVAESNKPTLRAKRATRTIERIEKRKKSKAMRQAEQDAAGPNSRNSSQGIQCPGGVCKAPGK